MMRRGSMDLCRWLLLAGFVCYSSCQSVSSTFENKTGQDESKPRVFSPRMDYDEWTPLGRGDPLKNNPTFDYVPPVLDRVQYWLDSHTTEPSAKRDILVLGVTAKKTSPKIPDQFLKFVDGPKFARPSQDGPFRNDFTGSTGAEPPKIVRTTNFRNGPIDYRNQNRIQAVPASYYPSPYFNQKTKPYTMMLPPPLVQKDKLVSFVEPTQQFSTQTEEGPVLQDSSFYAVPSKNYNQPPSQPPTKQSQNSLKTPSKGVLVSQIETIKSVYTPSSPQSTKSRYETMTTPSVSFEKSNLIYQSTQTLSGGWPGSNGPASTPATWQTPDYSRDQYDIDHHVAASSNHEVVVEQNANIIVDGESNENEEVVVGQKEAASSEKLSPTSVNVVHPSTNSSFDRNKENAADESVTSQSAEKMHIVVANSPASLDPEASKSKKGPVAVVMPTNYSEKKLNFTSQNSEALDFTTSIPEHLTTQTEMPKEKILKAQAQLVRNSVTSSPIFLEDSQSPESPHSSAVLPNRMISSHHQSLHPQPTPAPHSRHPASPVHAFGSPQAALQSMMHPQPRPNHAMMHFLGMRPSVGFRLPGSMSMLPPMTHMHAPLPMKPMTNHMGPPMDQSHRPPPMPDFPVAFTNSPSPSITAQAMGTEDHSFDHHRSRIPDITTLTTTTTPFFPTLSSIESSTPVTIMSSQGPETINHSPVGTVLNKEKENNIKDDIASTTTSPQITTVPSLTTDPIFSHYKQPAKPIRGPMYLIIQGHSKVKTYKPTVTKHGFPIENEIPEGVTEKQLSKFEQFILENTKSGSVNQATAEKKKAEEKARAEKLAQVRQNNLMSLVESGLGSFTVSPSSSATEEEHQPNSVTMIEVNGN
ncbi:uncharacterized protein LOC143182440 [Calliopsis andreniformis]|uniref:uncharacterized protein LOC143182440 n=1 Tax=Calliopsis andreniformis TaxID=337506 RepID=UPI003FCD711A